jgi:hypothetical protein
MSDSPILVDRSRITTFHRCPRERFLGYHFGGQGIARTGMSLPLVGGIAYHSAFENILKGGDLDTVIADTLATYETEVRARGIYGIDDSHMEFLIAEQSRLLDGLVRGWVATRMPLFLDRFEIHAIEQEFAFHLSPEIIQMMRLDVIARRRSDGMLFIPDFKGTGTAASYWREGFRHNDQVNSYILAVQETLQERVGGMVIEGLIKGQRKEDTALSSPFHGKEVQYSPFCYGYKHATSGEVQTEYTNRKGFVKIASWDHFTTIEWMEKMGEETVRDQFLVMEIPSPEKRELERWRRQTVKQELRIAEGIKLIEFACTTERELEREEVLDEYFPQTRSNCHRFNSHCPFEVVCYDGVVESDPIGSGFFQAREPHHDQEAAVQNG